MGSLELGVTEGEDAKVLSKQDVAVAIGRAPDSDDRSVQSVSTHRAEELRIAESEHTAVRPDQPVALAAMGTSNANGARL